MEWFLSCLPGLEPWLHAELRDLGLGDGAAQPGGVLLHGDTALALRANLHSGLASHVYQRLGAFHARSLGEVARKTARLPWRDWLEPGAPLRVRATCHRSRLYHSGAVVQRVVEGIVQALGAEPEAPAEGDTHCPAVLARLEHDTLTLSLDTTGEPLHRRAWHLARGGAPLRPDLARALVLASGWDRQSPLLDPFCGAGTVLIEAALLARRLPPGAGRRFAFERLVWFDPEQWREVVAEAGERVLGDGPPVWGSDRDLAAVRRARDNALRAGVADWLMLACCTASTAAWLADPGKAPPAGVIAGNPPFGRRLRGRGLRALYRRFGERARRLPGGWRIALLGADHRLVRAAGLDLQPALSTRHGGLPVAVWTGAAR